jgi:hypothetical protein
MTTCLEKAIPLHCMLLLGIIIIFLIKLVSVPTEKRESAQHGMIFLPHLTTKNFL